MQVNYLKLSITFIQKNLRLYYIYLHTTACPAQISKAFITWQLAKLMMQMVVKWQMTM